MRALRILRETTSLAATPELWPAIVAALGDSRHFSAPGLCPGCRVSRATSSPFLWHNDLESGLVRACEMVKRNLTATEWRRHAGTDVSYVKACPHLPDAHTAPP
jgi:hypothetical protein